MRDELKPYYEILVKNSPFFKEFAKDKYIGSHNEAIVLEIWGAYSIIDPNFKSPFGCPSCVVDMIRYANIHRVTYMEKYPKEEPKEVKPVQMNFPKQKRKKK